MGQIIVLWERPHGKIVGIFLKPCCNVVAIKGNVLGTPLWQALLFTLPAAKPWAGPKMVLER